MGFLIALCIHFEAFRDFTHHVNHFRDFTHHVNHFRDFTHHVDFSCLCTQIFVSLHTTPSFFTFNFRHLEAIFFP